MYIWPDGSVSGSEHVEAREAFWKAVAAGDSLEPFAQFIPPHLSAKDYPRPEKPKPAKAAPAKAGGKEE